MTDFKGLNLAQPLLRAIAEEGYCTPSPIQSQSITPLLEGHDLLGVAQTGTGKTAAFSLPMLHRLSSAQVKMVPRHPRALILAPTRELADQIAMSVRSYGRHLRLRSSVAFGGVSIRPQITALRRGVDVLVGTPGRLIDLMNQGHLRLGGIEIFVLDEADRMLDMGFIRDIRIITAKLPPQRQTVMFSATMPKDVQGLANGLLNEPVRVEVTQAATTVDKITQRVHFLPQDKKRKLLSHLMRNEQIERVLVFTRTKHGADRVARHLRDSQVSCDAIHGNKSQNARQRALFGFRTGKLRALVATDIAARGIDVDGISHVINFDLPNEPESYVHRIGRTARSGAEGVAISFCQPDERPYLSNIEKTIRQPIDVDADHPYHLVETADAPRSGKTGARSRKRGARKAYRNRRASTGYQKNQETGRHG